MSNRNRIINQRTAYLQMQQMHQTATYADYDAAGRLPGFTNFNGTQTAYGYDNANRLTAINNQKSDNSVIAGYAFALDANGNRTHIAQEEPYAPSIGEGDATYTYNTQKNRLLSTSAEGSFGYDDEGQLQTGYSTDYTFDYEHRLKTIGGTQFYYDGGGKRLKALRDGVTTRYIYDAGGALLAEADANNNITQYYIYGNGLLAMVTPGDQTYCYHYNGIGSTTAMTNSSQEIINKYSYDAFGSIANQQETISQPFKYVGQYGVMSEPNGFYYMKARYYDPTVGRFISEDPIGFGGGDVNLLAYVGNNPVTGIDPSGEKWFMPNGAKPVFGINDGPAEKWNTAGSKYMLPLEQLPNMHQTALIHDPVYDALKTGIGPVDTIINYVTMVPCAVAALTYNIVTTPIQIYNELSIKQSSLTAAVAQSGSMHNYNTRLYNSPDAK